jgi:predicted dehydrogenase
MNTTTQPWSRRNFLQTGAALCTVTILPRQVLGQPNRPSPNSELALAGIGIGGVGFPQLQACEKAGFRIAALCDVDEVYGGKAFNRWPQARRYRDFRDLLRSEGDKIDAVYVGTPDHTHAIIDLAALKLKKHLCCVKPLTRTIGECRAVVRAAREAGVATQVTAAPHTSEDGCRTIELIQGGAIGEVREVHAWTDRPLWPQGMDRPTGSDAVPKTFDWDLWIGPAPMRPFKDKWADKDLILQQIAANHGQPPASRGVYHPWNFRGWWDFGTGALGDMGCHFLNTVWRALKLAHPLAVESTSTRAMPEAAPLASIVTYDFAPRENMPAVRVTWYDGGLKPPAPLELHGRPLPEQGVLYVGSKGKMLGPKILGEESTAAAGIPKTLPRRGGTWQEWHEACRGGEPAGCNFDWAGPLTESVLLGNVALRSGKRLEWDPAQMRVTNHEPANAHVKETYHNGWTLEA